MGTALESSERAPYLTAKARRRVERERRRSKRRAGAVVTTEPLPADVPVRREKWDAPVLWPGATNFSEHAAQLNQVAVVRIARQCGLLDDFIDATDDVSPGGGRRRQPGSWALAFLAYAQSGEPNIQPWWRESAAEVWWEAGSRSVRATT